MDLVPQILELPASKHDQSDGGLATAIINQSNSNIQYLFLIRGKVRSVIKYFRELQDSGDLYVKL